MRKSIFLIIILLLMPLGQVLAFQNYSTVKVFNPYDERVIKSFVFPYQNFYFDLAAGDLDGDNKIEFIIANGKNVKPYITIFDNQGNWSNGFLARDEKYRQGLSVAVGDLGGDGLNEIITGGVASSTVPNIRIFNNNGILLYNEGFYPYGQNYKSSVSVAAFDVNGDGNEEVITGTGPGVKPEVKVFNRYGQNIGIDFFPAGFSDKTGINISGIDLGGDKIGEILISAKKGDKPLVAIYRTDGSLIREFLAFKENFKGGVNLTGYDVNNDGKGEILLAAGFSGGPHLKVTNGYGQDLISMYAYDPSFIGGVKVTKADVNNDGIKEIITVAERSPDDPANQERLIDINLKTQRFKYYDQGYLMADFITSTGKPSTPTRVGDFRVISKYPVAYGSGDGQIWKMPFFIGFYTSGNLENGIHELPFINGWREGSYDLGHAVSHGCVRLGIGPAEEVFNWVKIGDRIITHK